MSTQVPQQANNPVDIVFVHLPEASRDVYTAALAQEGYSVATFDCVEHARPRLASSEPLPQAVVLELLPTPEHAWLLIDDLRTSHPHLPVVVFTASVRPDRIHRGRARAAGVAAFVGKPCALRQFVDVIIRVLSGERGIEMIHYLQPN